MVTSVLALQSGEQQLEEARVSTVVVYDEQIARRGRVDVRQCGFEDVHERRDECGL
jgi:hypothetical protein